MSEKKPNAYFEGQTGPNYEYDYLAEVSYEPSATGLHNSRIQYLSVVERAPPFDDALWPEPEAYDAWLTALPAPAQVVFYEDGQLTLDAENPQAGPIVEAMKLCFSDDLRPLWVEPFEPSIAPQMNRARGTDDGGRER